MFNHILNIFKSKNVSNKEAKENYYNENISKAVKYQENGEPQEALKIYEKLYPQLKQDNDKVELALVLNNMLVAKKELKQQAKDLFKELLELRFSLLIQYEEYYAIDYIYTLLMGVEWFGLPKEKLTQAEKLLASYSEFSIYQPTLEKINNLRAVA